MESPSTYVTAGWMVERAAPGGPAPKPAAARAGEVKDGRSPPPWAVRGQRASLTALSVCENAGASRWSIGAREIACSVLIGGDVRRAYEPLPSLALFDGASAITPGRHRFPFHPTSLYACWEGNRETHRFPCPRRHQQACSRSRSRSREGAAGDRRQRRPWVESGRVGFGWLLMFCNSATLQIRRDLQAVPRCYAIRRR